MKRKTNIEKKQSKKKPNKNKKQKTELTLTFLKIICVLFVIVWFFMPNTYIKDGDYITTKLGLLRPFHYFTLYYLIKLYLTRIGFFIYDASKSLIGVAATISLDIIFRIFAYIRSAQLVTKWWVIGLVLTIMYVAIYLLDTVVYDVTFEDTTQ